MGFTDIRGEPAERVTRLFGLPGEAPEGGNIVSVNTAKTHLSVNATTTQAFAKLTIVPARELVVFSVTDIENGVLISRSLDGERNFTMHEQDWAPGSGPHGKPRAITPTDGDAIAQRLVDMTRQVIAIVKPLTIGQ